MRPQDDARRSPCSCSDQPPWLQAQGGGDHLPFFFGVFGSRSSLPASLAGFGPVPLPSLLVAIFTPPFVLIYDEDRDVIAVLNTARQSLSLPRRAPAPASVGARRADGLQPPTRLALAGQADHRTSHVSCCI